MGNKSKRRGRTPDGVVIETVVANLGPRHVEWLPIDQVKPAKKNPRDHDLPLLIEALQARGLGELPLLDERTGRLVAGHGRLKALLQMQKEGLPAPAGVVGDVDKGKPWLVPVIRGWSSKDDEDAAAYLIASTSAPSKGGWRQEDLDQLLVEVQKGDRLKGTGFDDSDVKKILRELEKSQPQAIETEETGELAGELYVKDGDVWRCGQHFLTCGDSLTREVQVRLFGAFTFDQVSAVVTDPPYAIYGSSTGIGADITDDRMVLPFFEKVLALAFERLPIFGHAYVFCDWRSYGAWWQAMKRVGLTPKNCIVWDKGGAGLGSNWANTHEFAFFLAKMPKAKAMASNRETGQRSVFKSNVLRHNRVTGKEREHNAAKPVALLVDLIEASTDKGGVVLDPFCGSGSTLIACELAGRRCLTVDVEPKWVQVAIERWQRKTGQKAQKVD